ncbi:MAG TPA: LytTR family DNA-binding domain-containing protein [Vicinamibacterales bacterium]|jgi:two-component system LytT family response regulator|nr:LytTR family DNA-binding domain-containing protein [Vicinamibacterales bacterium]
MTRVLIVDDERMARRRVRRLLTIEQEIAIVGECGDGGSAVKMITDLEPDIAFIDVQMPELDGFDVVESVPPDKLPAIVFVTAFDCYALRAFEVHAIDYLLKPFTNERFHTALTRARERVAARDPRAGIGALVDHLRMTRRHPARIAVRVGDRSVVIDWRNVDWIEAADNYVRLHVGTKDFLLRETIAAVGAQLDPDRFARVHRSAIVQVDRIAEFQPSGHGDVDLVLRNGVRLTLTRTWRDRVEWLFRPTSRRRSKRGQ